MEPVSLAASGIAFAQAAGICVKLGNSLICKYRAYRNASERIEDLVVRIEGVWVKTETQIEFLQNVAERIDEKLLDFQNACLERLQKRLGLAILELDSLTDTGYDSISLRSLSLSIKPLKKVQYAVFEKSLRQSVDDLEAWRKDFDPSWFLVGCIADASLDRALDQQSSTAAAQDSVVVISAIRKAIEATRAGKSSQSPVFRESDVLSPDEIPLSNSTLSMCSLITNKTPVLLDTTTFDADVDKVRYTTHVRDLARLLSLSRPETLGLLECLGVIKVLNPSGNLSQFRLIYNIPSNLNNATMLRTQLTSSAISLDARYRLAKSLARNVMAVHSADLVHKNIRPETIVMFEDSSDPLPVSFLVGFERFRPFGDGSNLTGDMVWQRNIYRYPNRQGIKPEEYYIMQHDIYSLGVCLLEIGMWTSFVRTSEPPQPGPRLDIAKQLAMKDYVRAAWETKKIFIGMAEKLLPSAMGLLYTEVVVACLTCLDQGTANMFANAKELYDEDGILVGVAFIENILMKLESVSLKGSS